MKIALVSQEYPPETARGGIGSQTYMKAHGLAQLGHEIFVISRSIDMQRHENTVGKITVIRIPGMENLLPGMTDIIQWLSHSFVVAAEIEILHKRVGLDIIDFPEWAAEAYAHLLNRTPYNSIPVVIQLHGPLVMFANTMNWPDKESEFYKTGTFMESTCVKLADAVYSSSECSAQWIKKYYNSAKSDIPVIHLGIDVTKFAPQPVLKNKRPTIIFVGKIVQNKGAEELVEATCRLVKEFPDLLLRLVGRGDANFINLLQEKADKFGASRLLDFPDYIHSEDLPIELSKAHVFCAPSYYEGGPGFVYLEAMACGLPVIGCSGSGVNEIVTSGETGLLVPPKNSKALEEALRKILSNETMGKSMGENAREFVLKESDTRACLRKLESYYLSVIQNQNKVMEVLNI